MGYPLSIFIHRNTVLTKLSVIFQYSFFPTILLTVLSGVISLSTSLTTLSLHSIYRSWKGLLHIILVAVSAGGIRGYRSWPSWINIVEMGHEIVDLMCLRFCQYSKVGISLAFHLPSTLLAIAIFHSFSISLSGT